MILSYDVARMRELLESFYHLTKIRIVVFNTMFEKVAEYPAGDSRFCALIRQNRQADAKCRESDRYACEQCKKTDGIYSYTCHAGLTETVTPIRYGSIVIGYIMFGQILQCTDKNAYWPTIVNRCKGYGVDTRELKHVYSKKSPRDLQQLRASAQILEACAGYLWLQRYISLQEDALPVRIDEYISNNLDADLSTAALCAQFGISRSRLYKIFSEYYGKGVEQATRQLRVEKAKALLAQGGVQVSEVAAEVGYADYNYFIKVFKKEVGVTPKRYCQKPPLHTR